MTESDEIKFIIYVSDLYGKWACFQSDLIHFQTLIKDDVAQKLSNFK